MNGGSTRSLRQHTQRPLNPDFVEPPSVFSERGNDDDDDDDGTDDWGGNKTATKKGRTSTRGGTRASSRGRTSRGIARGTTASSIIHGGRSTSASIRASGDDASTSSFDTSSFTTANNSTLPLEKSYYHMLLAGKVQIQTLVDQWIELYQGERDQALIELMQFFLDSSGCKGRLTPQMYLKMEHVDMLRAMTEHFEEDSSEYPIVMSGLQFKKFRLSFCEFVTMLIKQCSYTIIYDQYMIDNLVTLLTALSDSAVRAFRHTGTLAVLKVMTALVDIALTISIQKDSCQRQYESERQKSTVRRAADRMENLMAKRKE
ncbi:unnamed protein product, partial [Didymodactylos carnosus]